MGTIHEPQLHVRRRTGSREVPFDTDSSGVMFALLLFHSCFLYLCLLRQIKSGIFYCSFPIKIQMIEVQGCHCPMRGAT